MAKKIRLSNPHPGIMGATIPLPKEMKKIVDGLNGQVMDRGECLSLIEKEAQNYQNGKVELNEKYGMITFRFGEGLTHHYRLLCYKEVDK